MHRINLFAGAWRGLALALAVFTAAVAAAGTAGATELEEALPSGPCAVSALLGGQGDVFLKRDGEEGIVLSIRLDAAGGVSVNGEAVGQYVPGSLTDVQVFVDDLEAWIEVRDALTGELLCVDLRGTELAARVAANGSAITLDVQ